MAASIRPATAGDARFLAWTILAASRGHCGRGVWDLWVGDDEHEVLAFLERLVVCPEPSLCSWSGFLVAEHQGTPVAALCGYDPAAPGMSDAEPACRTAAAGLGWSVERQRAGDHRLVPFERCLMPVAPGAWVVEWVATRPEHRRGGLARALLAAVLDAGQRRGHAASQLTIFIGNTVAQGAYERAGFTAVEERRDAGFEAAVGCPGLRRMTRPL